MHAHWAIPTGPAAVLAARRLRRAQRDHHARRRRVREPGAGIRFSHSVVRAAAAPLDPAARRARSPRSPMTVGSTRSAPGRRPVHPTHLQRHRPAPLQSQRPTATGVDPRFGPQMIFACRQLFPRKGIRFLIEAVGAAQAPLPGPQAGPRGRRLRAPDAGPARGEARHRRRRHIPRLGAELGAAAVLPRRRGVRDSVAGGGVRYPRGRGHGLRGAGRRQRRRRAPGGGGARRHRTRRAAGRHGRRWPRRSGRCWRIPSGGRRMGVAGRERALRLFDWDRTAEQFEQLYRDIGAEVSR